MRSLFAAINPATWTGTLFFSFVLLGLGWLGGRLLARGAERVLLAHVVPPLHRLETALVAGVSVASLIAGLAAQPILGNVVAGIAILVYRPVRLDDDVVVNAPGGIFTGRIAEIGLSYVTVVAPDGRRALVPNTVIISQTVIRAGASAAPGEV